MVSLGQRQPRQEGVRLRAYIDYIELNHDIIFLSQYLLYLYCIHDNLVK
jgi:hypothetical protein